MDLQAIRNFVRTHMDLDVEDLPDDLLDTFAREATHKVERAEKRWPFYAVNYTFTTEAGVGSYDLSVITPGDLRQISAVLIDQRVLTYVGPDEADRRQSLQATGQPTSWSQWGNTIDLHPSPSDVYTLSVRGYRAPIDWVSQGAGAEPDMDSDLHMTVATWVLARAYAQQEDTELSTYFAQSFDRELDAFRRRIVDTPPPQPLSLSSGGPRRRMERARYDWEQ